jgi:aspartyl protease family protein
MSAPGRAAPRLLAAVVSLIGFGACIAAGAQAVALSGTMGERALVVIGDAPPVVLSPGDSRDGVRLISVDGDTALVEIQGHRQTLRIGASPVRVDGAGGATGASAGTHIVLSAGGGGHFVATGQINGATVRFVVDTGASTVALSASQATRIGLNYRAGERVVMGTANGNTAAYRVTLDSVRIGDVEVFGVEATVVPADMPYVLLGNTFLSRFRIRQENNLMMLDRRY